MPTTGVFENTTFQLQQDYAVELRKVGADPITEALGVIVGRLWPLVASDSEFPSLSPPLTNHTATCIEAAKGWGGDCRVFQDKQTLVNVQLADPHTSKCQAA